MFVLHIEHSVPNFNSWKQAFDSDPAGRKKMGVRRYHILRALDDPNYVMIDLEFDTARQAEALLEVMKTVWKDVDGKIIFNPKARILEVAEEVEFEHSPIGT